MREQTVTQWEPVPKTNTNRKVAGMLRYLCAVCVCVCGCVLAGMLRYVCVCVCVLRYVCSVCA